ncbi:MAG: hypothetical protein M1822_001738 [Bathelium mastoideum]|nr:MAG: hypothetical protein M1822_001738 [Bathelium mastoideum]
MATFMTLPPAEMEKFAVTNIFATSLPLHEATLQRVFTRFREDYGEGKPIICIGDTSFMGIIPDAYIAIGLVALSIESNDSHPFHFRAIHWQALQKQQQRLFFKDIHNSWTTQLTALGTTADPFPTLWHAFNALPDLLLQLNLPDFEHPRTDLPPTIRYIGPPPVVGLGPRALPTWWNDVLAAAKAGRPIIAVTSGSVDNNPDDLIWPTLRALADRDDLLLVATLLAQDPDAEME